jgi:hypothetical protein
MALRLANPDRLFDRTWRPSHPLRPKLSAARRWGMLILLLTLCAVIIAYNWLTNPQRVREMAGNYLSELLGGEVTIGKANLSVFEGLRLDDVTLRVSEPARPDSTIFHAQTFILRYQPQDLLTGRINATEIDAIDPIVMLVEDPHTHLWNYQRIWNGADAMRRSRNGNTFTLTLPQIFLRDAQVAYMELRDGKTHLVGWYGMEGKLAPTKDPNEYDITLQSRGLASMGPSVDGTIRTDGGPSVARLRNFTFGPDIKAMLMPQPRAWCEWHQLQGRMDVPEMFFTPAIEGRPESFRVEIALSDVELAVHPEEWMSAEQNQRTQWLHDQLDAAASRGWISRPWADSLRSLSTPKPIHLRQASGTLVFTEKGITIRALSGKLEGNWFNIDGTIDGYSPNPPATVTVSTLPGHDLEIPAFSPTNASSLPHEVQETYERLRPQGMCGGWVKLVRKINDKHTTINVTGELQIHDGQFCFDNFPYPLTRANGSVIIGPDPIAQMEGIRIMNLQGHGLPGGPNENCLVTVDGFIGPLGGQAGGRLDIRGTNVSTEPALRAALPPPVKMAMRLFDTHGGDDSPKMHGDFLCHIVRPFDGSRKWRADTDMNFDDFEGTLAAFPYPISKMSGRIEVRDGQLNIIGAQMRKGDGTLNVDGKITWKTNYHHAPNQIYGPDLQFVGRNLPIDDDVKAALPELQRGWLQRWGASGLLDLDGHLFPVDPYARRSTGSRTDDAGPRKPADIDYLFNVALHDGSLRPGNGQFVLSDVRGNMKITPRQLVLDDLSAHRGDCVVQGYATVAWDSAKPSVFLSAAAEKLTLDSALREALPPSAQDGWDSMNPQGTIDASMTYNSAPADSTAPDKFEIRLRPRELAVTPRAVPYRLDQIQGLVTITPQSVVLTDIKGRHGDARLWVAGQGSLDAHPVWDLKLALEKVPVDNDFIEALPPSLADLCKSAKLHGKLDIDFSHLAYRPAPVASSPTNPTTQRDSADDMDFAAKLIFSDTSVDIGFPARDMQGSIDLAGLIRAGKLHRLAARAQSSSLTLAGRAASNFTVDLAKPGDDPVIQVSHLSGSLAGGDIAGEGQFTYPDDAPSKYDINLVLRDADVQEIEHTGDKKLQGRLTASIEMGGSWSDPSTRRGHGDVSAVGQEMYNIPVVLGLLQITNLALPVSSPFSEANARYSIDGQKVIFEKINLKSKDMTMSGNGELDFGAKKVSLWLVTDNPALVSLPVVGPLIHGAKQELLKIHVSGTIQQPTVSAHSFDTITTTVDQVFNGDDQK